MGAFEGSYSRFMFDPVRQYVKALRTQNQPIVDADVNDNTDMLYWFIQSFLENFVGDTLFFSDAFQIEGWTQANSFRIHGGLGYVQGNPAYLDGDVELINNGSTVLKKNVHSISTSLTAQILTDTAREWVVDELIGRKVIPNIEDGTAFTIIDNDENTITVAPTDDMTTVAEAGDTYRITLTTPSGAPRTDTVWLNFYLDEIDPDEDTNLKHNLGTGVPADHRLKARTIIEVEQGGAAYPTSYVDFNGLQHYRIKLATLDRPDGAPNIEAGHVTDERTNIFTPGAGSDQTTVKVTSNDSTPGYLKDKLKAGTSIILTEEDDGGNEQLRIDASGGAFTDEKVKASATDIGTEAYLYDKLVAGANVTISKQDAGTINEKVKVASDPGTDENVKVSITDGIASGLQAKCQASASSGVEITKTGGPSPSPEFLNWAVKDLPWDSAHVKTDGAKEGHLAAWATGGVPTTVAPAATDTVLTSNGPGTAASFKQAPYTPAASGDWSGDPTTVKEALDRIAAAVATLLGGPIP